MLWFILSLLSALSLGFYDVSKKIALRANAVVPVLFINTSLCALLSIAIGLATDPSELIPDENVELACALVSLKAVIVLSSWLCGYFSLKHLPITIVGPVNATRPVLVLLGAVFIYGEGLNMWQWAGVLTALVAFTMLKVSSNREGIRWAHNRWVVLLVMAALLGAVSGLYDKFLLSPSGVQLNRLFVQAGFNTIQALLMLLITGVLWWPNRKNAPFRWHPAILCVSVFLTLADFVYFQAMSQSDAMISIVSMVRRSSVLVSFAYGAFVLHERNLRAKALDLALLLFSLVLMAIGNMV